MSELLGFDIFIQSIGESEGNKEDAYDKYNRMDIMAKSVSKELINPLSRTYQTSHTAVG